MFNKETKEKYNTMIINLDKSGNKRYRKNYLKLFIIEKIYFFSKKNIINKC
jgi:hypothetical protein